MSNRHTIIQDFKEAVNMTPNQLEKWLNTEESKQVGQKDGSDESIGHKSGKRIIELLQSSYSESDYSEDDIAHMQKVISYVRRHSAQRPSADVKDTHWRFSLMNWGHDPMKESS
jgi:hypothetical protein